MSTEFFHNPAPATNADLRRAAVAGRQHVDGSDRGGERPGAKLESRALKLRIGNFPDYGAVRGGLARAARTICSRSLRPTDRSSSICSLPGNPIPVNHYVRLAYQVLFSGKPLMDTSFMGLNIRDQPILGVNVGLTASKKTTVDETYTVPAGKTKRIRDHYNALTAEYLQNGSLGRRINVEARVYDDGVAFRYLIPWSNQMARRADRRRVHRVSIRQGCRELSANCQRL